MVHHLCRKATLNKDQGFRFSAASFLVEPLQLGDELARFDRRKQRQLFLYLQPLHHVLELVAKIFADCKESL